jgi:hypothetical protein
MNFIENRKKWIDSVSPSLWFNLELLNKNEEWLLKDDYFLVLLEVLMDKISVNLEYLSDLVESEHFPCLIKALAMMESSIMLRLCSLASKDMLFEKTILEWCERNKNIAEFQPFANVLLARYNWLINQDVNERLFGSRTRKAVLQIVQNMV